MPRPRRHGIARTRIGPSSAAQPLDQLDARLADQSVVDQAVGMLMAYYGVSAPTAGAALRRWAENAELPLVHMAAGVVEAGSQPSRHPFGTLRRVLGDRALENDPDVRAPAGDDR